MSEDEKKTAEDGEKSTTPNIEQNRFWIAMHHTLTKGISGKESSSLPEIASDLTRKFDIDVTSKIVGSDDTANYSQYPHISSTPFLYWFVQVGGSATLFRKEIPYDATAEDTTAKHEISAKKRGNTSPTRLSSG